MIIIERLNLSTLILFLYICSRTIKHKALNSSVLKSISCLIFLTLTFSSYAQEVRIGKQVWHEKNLDLAFFRNGDPIPQAQSKEEWTKAIEDNNLLGVIMTMIQLLLKREGSC